MNKQKSKKYYIIKQTGSFGRDRYIVKGFKCLQTMHKFLSSQTGCFHNQYIEHTPDGAYRGVPQKSGTYAYAGGQYVNIKKLEPWQFAHV